MNCAIYGRVSTADKNQDVEMQLTELRTFARSRGWIITAEFTDVCSGAKDSRPGLNKMVAIAHSRKIDAICIWKLDRLSRSLSHLVNLLKELTALGVALVSVRDNLDLTTPSGRAMYGMIAVMAEFERDLISERVRAGMAHAKNKGKKLGRKKVDLTKDKDAQFIREARKMKASYGIIAKELKRPVGSVYNIAKALGCSAPGDGEGSLALI